MAEWRGGGGVGGSRPGVTGYGDDVLLGAGHDGLSTDHLRREAQDVVAHKVGPRPARVVVHDRDVDD